MSPRERGPDEREVGPERGRRAADRADGLEARHDQESRRDAEFLRAVLRPVGTARCPDPVVARINRAIDELESRSGSGEAAPRPRSVIGRALTRLAVPLWRPALAAGLAIGAIAILAVRDRDVVPVAVVSERSSSARAGIQSFCDDDVDALLARVDLGDLDAAAARRAAEDACLALEIFARAMRTAAGAAEAEVLRSLETPILEGVGSGIERLPTPLRRPERDAFDSRG